MATIHKIGQTTNKETETDKDAEDKDKIEDSFKGIRLGSLLYSHTPINRSFQLSKDSKHFHLTNKCLGSAMQMTTVIDKQEGYMTSNCMMNATVEVIDKILWFLLTFQLATTTGNISKVTKQLKLYLVAITTIN